LHLAPTQGWMQCVDKGHRCCFFSVAGLLQVLYVKKSGKHDYSGLLYICGKCLDFGGGTSFLSKRACLHSSGPAKYARMEIKVEMISGMAAAILHTSCRKDSSRPTTIKKTQGILKQVRPEVSALLSPGSSLRSSPPDLRLYPILVIFCGKLAVEWHETKRALKYRKVIFQVRT